MTSLCIKDDTGSIFDSQIDITGTFTSHIPPGNTGTWSWIIERYGYLRQTGSFDVSINTIIPTLNFTTDIFVSETNRSIVETYTSFTNLDQLYNYCSYFRTQEPQYVLAIKVGSILDFGETNIVVDSTASSIWDYNQVTDTLTIKSTLLSAGNFFGAIRTTGSITTVGSQITAIYISDAGVSQNVEFRNIPEGATMAVYDESGTIKQYWSNVSAGTHTLYIEPGVNEVWTWAMEKYGNIRNEFSFPANVGGVIFFVPTTNIDVSITETVAATVSSYTTIDTIDQLYDASALFRTTQTGIVVGNLFTRTGNSLALGDVSLTINKTASTVFSANATSITAKSNTLSIGSKFTQLTSDSEISSMNGATYFISAIDMNGTRSLLTISGISSGTKIKLMDGTTELASDTSSGSVLTLMYFLPPGVLSINSTIYAGKATGNTNGFSVFTGSAILGQALSTALITMSPDTFYGRSAGMADRANVSVSWNSVTKAPTITLTNDTNIRSIYDVLVESHATLANLTYNRPSTNDGNVYQFANAIFTGTGKILGTTQFYTTGRVDVKYDLILNAYNTVNFPTNSIIKVVKSDNTVLVPYGVNTEGKIELNLDANTDYRVYVKAAGKVPKSVYINSGTGRVITISPVDQASYSANTVITELIPSVRLAVEGTMLNVYLSGMSVIPLKVVALVDWIQQQEKYADVALATENGNILFINDTNQITPAKANVNFLRENMLAASQSVMWQTYFSTGSLSYPDPAFTPEDSNQLFVNSFSSAIGQVVLMDSQVAVIATTAANQVLDTVLSNGKTVRTNINEIDILSNIISVEVQKSN